MRSFFIQSRNIVPYTEIRAEFMMIAFHLKNGDFVYFVNIIFISKQICSNLNDELN